MASPVLDPDELVHIKEIALAELPSRRAWERAWDHVYLWLIDHGFLRAVYSNRYRLAGGLYRSSQLSPGQVLRLSKSLGLRSLVNLRGIIRQGATLRLEAEASRKRAGLRLFVIRSLSRGLLSREELLQMMDFIKTMELPALVHCKSGADRAGHFSVLYRHLRLGEPIERAVRELNWRYGHFPTSRTGFLDHFFKVYLRDRQPFQSFEDWLRNDYDRQQIRAGFKPTRLASWITDRLLRRE